MSTPATDRSPVRLRRVTVLAGAVLAALAVWALAVPVAGLELAAAPIGGQVAPVGPVAVAAGPFVSGLCGWALLAALERWTARPRRTWTAIALVVLAVSLVNPLAGGADVASVVVLALMHLVTGAVLIPLLPRR